MYIIIYIYTHQPLGNHRFMFDGAMDWHTNHQNFLNAWTIHADQCMLWHAGIVMLLQAEYPCWFACMYDHIISKPIMTEKSKVNTA